MGNTHLTWRGPPVRLGAAHRSGLARPTGPAWRPAAAADPGRDHNRSVQPRLWLWPNLLSLDAPIVALLWQVFFLRCFHASFGLLPAVLLAIAVWLIYAADRMLDAWRGAAHQARHRFYRRHWRIVLPLWTLVLAAGVWLAITQLPAGLFAEGAILGGAALLYLAAVHRTPALLGRAGSKEAAVAIVFALGASLTAWSQVHNTADVLAIALFSLLCWMNCTAIEDWERGGPVRAAVVIAAGLVAVASALFLRDHRPIIGCAETAAALGLMLLDRSRAGVSVEAQRVLADAVLLTPLLLLPVIV